jgi:hypothetical protein
MFSPVARSARSAADLAAIWFAFSDAAAASFAVFSPARVARSASAVALRSADAAAAAASR